MPNLYAVVNTESVPRDKWELAVAENSTITLVIADAAPLNGLESALDIALDNGLASKINASNKVIEALYH